MWGFVAVFCLGFVFVFWLGQHRAADAAPLGGSGSIAVVALAMFLTVLGTGGSVIPALLAVAALRWILVSALGMAGTGVVVLAVGNLVARDPHQPELVAVGLLLLTGAVGMGGVLTEALRRSAPKPSASAPSRRPVDQGSG